MRHSLAAIGVALACACTGCSVIKIQTAGKDDVEVTRRFGIVSVDIKPGAGAVVVDSSSVGVINGFEGFAVGYHSATLAAMAPGSCRLVVWIKTDEELKQLNELLRDRADVCTVRP